MKNPYEILEIKPSASEAEIKKAYRKKAQAVHPDKGGDTELFQEIAKAYEILSNAEKREHFDKTGEEFHDDIKAEVIGAMIQIVMGAIQSNEPTYTDIIVMARNAVEQQQSKHKSLKSQIKRQVDRLKDASSRITVVEGKENIISSAILANITNLQKQILEIDKIIQIGGQIIEMLQDYSYKKETAPIWGTMSAWSSTTA
ncbi:MAG: J domain-containing protein [Ignavibacteriales bacterium]|nr:J domain-containing protein [Ignavibacteriales bacterium]